MLANKQTIKQLMNSIVDMKGSALYRRVWADRSRGSNTTMVNMCFRFTNRIEADAAAQLLSEQLAQQGYTNCVKRTSTQSQHTFGVTWGGEYVRLTATA